MTIQEILDNILHAVFGKDVRQSIHDGIKTANDICESTEKRQTELEKKYDLLIENSTGTSPSDMEIVEARVKADGTAFERLVFRLNASDKDITEVNKAIEATNKEVEETKEDFAALKKRIFSDIYPVGCIYLSVSPTNPGSLFGGTWAAMGQGRTLVGVDTSQAEFNTVGKTGGAKTHKLSVAEMPSHNHKGKLTMPLINYLAAGSTKDPVSVCGSNTDFDTSSAGGGAAHNNLQPYITCYMWKRTA